ncbi:MAG: hypothetical protein OWQ51_04855 [Pyrobaculum arsenaticum]|uniref:Uncharacterized protein n=1 Tax=Pyrobaculum arsenaticum TaxID=121277 RepID=A0A7L4P6J5_9CREN|nr:hypothetical protein [Pyrobaculum arsenaticum]MCY0890297.1 hypothetical protein [Pyrobaculum arsenaticum]NYR14745.1 hypothetical protein [Pyrobaculum arsenaticum]
MQVVFHAVKNCKCGNVVYVEVPQREELSIRCPKCGASVQFSVDEFVEEVKLRDCEVRDWERIGALSTTVQQMVLQALESGRAPKGLWPLLVKLRDVGALICT